MKNALTFDVEEYFHAEAFSAVVRAEAWDDLETRVVEYTDRILDLIDRAGVRATFFVLGWVAERHPRLVREIAALGHEVACHGHAHRMIHRQRRGEFAADVHRAKGVLENITGQPVHGYRAPTFSITRETLWGLEVLAEAGFRYDSSIFPIMHDRYGIPDAPRFPHRRLAGEGQIVEFPPSTVELLGRRVPVAGGGYFRLLPYGVTAWAIRRINEREGQPAMVYLHPWEIDAGQPRLPAGWLTLRRHLLNVDKTEGRLARLLDDFDFAPVGEVLSEVGLVPVGDRK